MSTGVSFNTRYVQARNFKLINRTSRKRARNLFTSYFPDELEVVTQFTACQHLHDIEELLSLPRENDKALRETTFSQVRGMFA